MRLLACFLFLVLCSVPAWGQTPASTQTDAEKFSVRVQVEVRANESIKSQILSYVNRELRSLGDVMLTDNSPRYRIEIVALDLASVGLVALSIVTIEQLDEEIIKVFLSSTLRKDINESDPWFEDFRSYGRIEKHSLRTGPRKDLREFLENYVAEFDAEILEEDRKIWGLLHPAK